MNKIEKFLGLEHKISQKNFVRGTKGYYCIKRQDTNLADKELMVRDTVFQILNLYSINLNMMITSYFGI